VWAFLAEKAENGKSCFKCVSLVKKKMQRIEELNLLLQECICQKISISPKGASSNVPHLKWLESGAENIPGNCTQFSEKN
jgi:hypothetical protein